MSRREMLTLRELIDFFRSEMGEDVSGEIAEERVAQAINAFEVLEEQYRVARDAKSSACR